MNETWSKTLRLLEQELTPHVFQTWLKPIQPLSFENQKLVLETPSKFYRERIEQEYADKIREKLRESTADPQADVHFVINGMPSAPSGIKDLSIVKREIEKRVKETTKTEGLASTFTFESFVIGNANQFAHAATFAVAQAPGQIYNPVFIYGGVGLGKTHLLAAVGNHIAKSQPTLRIVYRTSEQFVNELIHAIRFEKTEAFRNRYRDTCDVLLIDDIQFFGGKERTQEEFFHTFNTLHAARKQMVFTSDKLPKDIPNLDDRICSRIQWGLFCDIQPPDVETRIAILKKKSEALGFVIPDDVAFFLAKRIRSNVRELEGALIRLAAYRSISGLPVSLAQTKDIFGTLLPMEQGVTVDEIQRRVAEFFNLNVSDLKSARRHKVVALPRQAAMYLSRKLTSASFPEIGNRFGGKDHTTVMHAVEKIEKLLQQDSPLRNTIAAIEQTLAH